MLPSSELSDLLHFCSSMNYLHSVPSLLLCDLTRLWELSDVIKQATGLDVHVLLDMELAVIFTSYFELLLHVVNLMKYNDLTNVVNINIL